MVQNNSNSPIIVWFRNDLRIHDNTALSSAVQSGRPIVALYVLDDESPGKWVPGAASRWWLHESLKSLSEELATRGGKIILRRGSALSEVVAVANAVNASAVHASCNYEPWAAELEKYLKGELSQDGIPLHLSSGVLLHDPETLTTQSGTSFKIYTPFWRAFMAKGSPHQPKRLTGSITFYDSRDLASDKLEDWGLPPSDPDWASEFRTTWQPGEKGAQERLKKFLTNALNGYAKYRDHPDFESTSRLSPHLHFGEISPATVWYALGEAARRTNASDQSILKFQQELVWREFSAHLLFHFPMMPEKPFKDSYEKFPWREDHERLRCWQKGQTGYPIVDAGMRELWHTGWMHNRVRMIVASYLIKDLLIPWQEGEAWFWDTLVDADLANNAAGWQWVAGSGADAAPFFRIFNPVTQGEKFDPEGRYVRRWIPELAKLPSKFIHAPWQADNKTLQDAEVELGSTYPKPIVDHARARKRALQALSTIKR